MTYVSNGAQGGRLTCDPDDLDRLHQFAAQLGLPRASWRPRGIMPHYAPTPPECEAALRAGAMELSTRDQLLDLMGRWKRAWR